VSPPFQNFKSIKDLHHYNEHQSQDTCTYLEIFFFATVPKTIKEAGAKKRNILGRQKFLCDGVAEGSKNWPNENCDHIVYSIFMNFNFNKK
jgi:hypothetical protein